MASNIVFFQFLQYAAIGAMLFKSLTSSAHTSIPHSLQDGADLKFKYDDSEKLVFTILAIAMMFLI